MTDANEQRDIDLEYLNYLQEFGKELESDFEKSKAAEKIKAFAVIPEKLKYYLQQLEALKKEKLAEKADENLVNSEEKKKKEQELITKIAQEFFIFSCASTNSMEASLEFHKNCKLRVQELSNFGENNLSPLAAAMLAGKSKEDLNKLIEKGAEPNAKNKFGQTAAEMAMMEKVGVKKQQSNTQDDEEERRRPPKAVKRKFTTVMQEDSSQEDQQSEEMQQRQLAEAAMALEMHEVEMMKLLRVAIRKKEALEKVQEQKTATETVEKSSTETHLEKEKQSAENALAKALGLGLGEKGAEPNAKNKFGQTAAEMAMMEKVGVKKQQSNTQDDEEERRRPPKAVKRKFTTVMQEDSSQEDQQSEEMQQRQLAEAAMALEMHEVEMMKLLRVAIRKKEALEKVQEQKTATETVEKSSTETHLEKEKQSAENALAKALGLGLGEKIDINKMLFEAVQNGRPMFALLLIRFGADVNHKENGVTILGAAIAGGNNSLISILSDFSNPENRKAALDSNRGNEAVLKLVGGSGEVERPVKYVPQLKRDAKMIEEIKDSLSGNQKESIQRNRELDVSTIPKVTNNHLLKLRPPSPSPQPRVANLVQAPTIFQGISVTN